MTELINSLRTKFQDLKTMRDELKLKAHLAKADAKSMWEDLEKKWPELETSLRGMEHGGREVLDGTIHATSSLIKEIESGYKALLKNDAKPA